jgi:hypothetical protein
MPKNKPMQGLMRKPSESELEYFKNNPTVTGMATEDNRVIINPYSKLSAEEKQAVALNEAARVKMRTTPELKPNFDLTPEQTKFLDSNVYKQASDEDRKATIAARILSGDPSAGTPTDQQRQFVETLKGSMSEENTSTPMGMALGGSVESPVSVPVQPAEAPATLVVPKFGMAKGGTVAKQTQRMLKQGGMMQEGGTVDPVSGNDVPVGAMQEEVRDDIPAQLSEGEFVFPADVVRFIGLERLMMMRQAAKEGLGKMEAMGQMSNADEATEEDTGEFESQIDEIMGELGEEKNEEEEEEDVEMAVGGMATDPAAMAQTQQALAQDQQPQNAALTEDQLNAINITAEGMKAQQMEVPPEKQSKPTEGLTSADIIRQDASKNKDPAKVESFLQKVDKLAAAKKALIIRHNDTVTVAFIKPNGAIDPLVFTKDTPERVAEAAEAMLSSAKRAGIKRIESNANPDTNIAIFNKLGYPAKKEDPKTGIAWSLDL